MALHYKFRIILLSLPDYRFGTMKIELLSYRISLLRMNKKMLDFKH